MNFVDKAAAYRARVDAAMERYLLSREVKPAIVHAAMRYAVLGFGKRIRPLLAYAAGEALGVTFPRNKRRVDRAREVLTD